MSVIGIETHFSHGKEKFPNKVVDIECHVESPEILLEPPLLMSLKKLQLSTAFLSLSAGVVEYSKCTCARPLPNPKECV